VAARGDVAEKKRGKNGMAWHLCAAHQHSGARINVVAVGAHGASSISHGVISARANGVARWRKHGSLGINQHVSMSHISGSVNNAENNSGVAAEESDNQHHPGGNASMRHGHNGNGV